MTDRTVLSASGAVIARERTSCRLCGCKHLQLAVRVAGTPPGDHFVPAERLDEPQPSIPHDLMLCPDCFHVQLSHVVDPDFIYGQYTYRSSVSLELHDHFRQHAADVGRQARLAPGGFVVELGSNEGLLLRGFRDHGARVLGVDPASEIAARATAAGVETWPTYFTAALAAEIRATRGPADLLIANNVIANIDHLDDLAAGVRALLAPHGIFVFETSYWADVVEHALLDTVFHEHLSYFTVRALQPFFARHGLELIAAERVSTKGGSLRGTVQLAGGPRSVEPSVAAQIERETVARLDQLGTYQAFEQRLAHVGHELRRALEPVRAAGQTIAAYGAAVGLTTMLYHFDLGPLVSFIVDDNPVKQHRYSPGLHLPVLPSSALYERRPEVVVVLAWRYAEAILRQHAAYVAQGGTFVVPLPTLQIVSESKT